jgi:short-subunit dehydrogenase
MPTANPLAIITGASAGLGAEYARQLAARGYDLVLIARRTQRLEELASQLAAAHPVKAEVVTADLADNSELERVAALVASNPRLELLVNNAGFGLAGGYYRSDPAAQRTMYLLHVVATARLTQAALTGMIERRRGGIINLASVAAFVLGPGNVSYCTTKAWIKNFTEGIWMELRMIGSPVKVQALCPGFTHTEFHRTMGVPETTIGESWWMSAEFVIRESLKGLERGDRIVVPGWRYKILVALLRIAPRGLVLRLAARRYSRL